MLRSNIFEDEEELVCEVCGKNLMDNIDMSLINIIQNVETRKIVAMKPCCKGKCDEIIRYSTQKGEVSVWKDMRDFSNPYLYIRHIIAVMESMYDGKGFENREAFDEYKKIVLSMYPFITRNSSKIEDRRAIIDAALPF
jgi:hypothetical protein